MRTTQIRQQLHDYIDSAEDKKLKAIYTLLEDDLSGDYQLTTLQKEELDKRYSDHQESIGKTYSWDETVSMAEQTLRERKGNKSTTRIVCEKKQQQNLQMLTFGMKNKKKDWVNCLSMPFITSWD